MLPELDADSFGRRGSARATILEIAGRFKWLQAEERGGCVYDAPTELQRGRAVVKKGCETVTSRSEVDENVRME